MLNTILVVAVVIVVFFILFKIFSFIMRILLIVIFLLLAYYTNPSLEAHIRAVENKAEQTNTRVSPSHISVNDYKIFSLTQIQDKDEQRVIGVGGFTRVFVFGKIQTND